MNAAEPVGTHANYSPVNSCASLANGCCHWSGIHFDKPMFAIQICLAFSAEAAIDVHRFLAVYFVLADFPAAVLHALVPVAAACFCWQALPVGDNRRVR